jgi:hypothetical protein
MRAPRNHVAHPIRFVSGSALVLALAASLPGCGDYDPPQRAAAGSGGQMATLGALEPSGQAAMGGTGGSNGATAMGGSSPAAGGTSGTLDVEPVEASCEAVVPCGGNVVGTWAVAGSCLPVSGMVDVAGFGLGCTTAAVTGMLEVTGTWTANADGTFMDQTVTSGDSQLALPPECLNVSGTVTTCDRLGGAFQALGYAAVTCADAAGGGCTCSATAQQAGGLAVVAFGPPSSGTYTTANDVLTTSAGGDQAYAYCVSGNTMVMTPQTPGKTGTLTGTIAFVKP